MKKLLLAFLLVPVLASAQDCKLISEVDPFTKQTRLSTGFIYVDVGSINVDADNKEIIVLFSIDASDKCFDDNTTMEIFFEGLKSKTTARTQSTMNCEGSGTTGIPQYTGYTHHAATDVYQKNYADKFYKGKEKSSNL